MAEHAEPARKRAAPGVPADSGGMRATALDRAPAVQALAATGRMLNARAVQRLSSHAPVLQGYFMRNGVRMSDLDVRNAIAADARLSDAMKGEIWRRHGTNQRFLFENTSAALISGDVTPRAPPAAGSAAITRREAAGLGNLSHMDSRMMPLFERAAHTPPPADATRSLREHLESPNRQYWVHTPTHTQAPKLVKGHGQTVMGHGPEDAVDYWNRIGHTQPRAVNKAHNSSVAVYHGLEDKYASAASGGATVSRYDSPNPAHGSHPSYYDRSQPGFDPRVPWSTYANATDAANGVRYVPPAAPGGAFSALTTAFSSPPLTAASLPAMGGPATAFHAFSPGASLVPSLAPLGLAPPQAPPQALAPTHSAPPGFGGFGQAVPNLFQPIAPPANAAWSQAEIDDEAMDVGGSGDADLDLADEDAMSD